MNCCIYDNYNKVLLFNKLSDKHKLELIDLL